MADQRMKEYKISSFADIVQALRENPEWTEELRKILLTKEPLELSKKFGEFKGSVGNKLKAIGDKVEQVRKDVNEIKQKLDKYLNTIGQELQEVKRMSYPNNFKQLKGLYLEMKVMENVSSFFSEYLLNARAVSQEGIKQTLSLAVKKKVISNEEMEDVLRLDLIVKGTLRNTNTPGLLAVEVSCRIERHDVERAVRRAKILEKAAGTIVLPTVVGYIASEHVQKLITETGCLKVLVSE